MGQRREQAGPIDEVVNDHPELAAVNFTVEAAAGPAGPVLVDAREV